MSNLSRSHEAELLIDISEDLPEVRPFPQAASRIMAACDDPSTKADDLCDIIQCDPSVSLRILRAANGVMYGLGGGVRTLRHAIVVLGYRALRNLAISVAAAELFQETPNEAASEGRQRLWQHSLACASIARLLSAHVRGVSPEEAFLAGVVHDVGKLMFLDLAAEKYVQLNRSYDSYSILAAETLAFGIDHQALGLRCADEWGLPLEIAETVGAHHPIPLDSDQPLLAQLVVCANMLSHQWGLGSDRMQAGPSPDQVLPAELPFSPELLEKVRQQAVVDFEQIQQAYRL